MSREEAQTRGWEEIDVVIVTGDAYVDHPSFAAAILSRVLQTHGYRVGIVPQPDWHNCQAWRVFGRPRLFFAVSAGNMDSMLNHYTANRKVRNDDAFSPGGRIGMRPDRATLAYCQRAREAYKGVPIIAGGVEAGLRRLAHYDYWSDTVRRSILLDAKADLVVFGMGESAIVEIADRLSAGQTVKDMRDMRGVAYALGAGETPPCGDDVVQLPSYEDVKSDKRRFAEATRRIHLETNPYNARTFVQYHDRQAVVCNPPRLPESEEAIDSYYDPPYTRRPHPSYAELIPAFEMIKDSVTIMRGCFGGCAFCSITLHQGRIVQSRSKKSIIREISSLGRTQGFQGIISDIGGPTANMYDMRCRRPDIEAACRRLSCIYPTICRFLDTDHAALVDLMREARRQQGVRKALVASGIRMDLARRCPEYIDELAAHHVGGHLKVAPEHTDPETLRLMKKPGTDDLRSFADRFRDASQKAGKEQYLVPYFIAGHPGCDLNAAIDLAVFLQQNGYCPEQVQDFIPTPMDLAACMYHTGLDPMTMKPVYVPKHLRERKVQRALMQYFKPENYFLVRIALTQAGRRDLIGDGRDCLIPAKPPQAAIEARRQRASRVRRPDGPAQARDQQSECRPDGPRGMQRRRPGSTIGYRPHRRGAGRRRTGGPG